MHRGSFLALAAILCLGAATDRATGQTPANEAQPQSKSTTEIVTLGTRGGPLSPKDRAQSSNLLIVGRPAHRTP